jgi:hypothetical protein
VRKPHAIIHLDFFRRLVLCVGQLVDHARRAALGSGLARRPCTGSRRYRARGLRHAFGLVAFTALPAFAATPADINADFPGLIAQNQAHFSRLTDHEVFRLAQAYTFANHGDPYALAAVISDPVQRARYLKVAQEVQPVLTPRPVLPRHVPRRMAAGLLVPNVGMTLDEIYLVYRTGQSMTVTAALYETSYYVGLNVGVAWGVGWYTGSAVSYLLQNYAPGVDNGIGATLAFLMDGGRTVTLAQWNALLLAANAGSFGGGGNPVYDPPHLSAPPEIPGAPGVPDPHGTITVEPIPDQYNPHGYPPGICEDIAWSTYDGAHC